MSQKGQQIINCKNCGSNRIQLLGPATFVLSFITVGSCLLWFIITIPISIICFIMAFIFLFLPFRIAKCHECKHSQRISKEKYKELKCYLRGWSSEKIVTTHPFAWLFLFNSISGLSLLLGLLLIDGRLSVTENI